MRTTVLALAFLFATLPAQAAETRIWSTPPQTRQVDPEHMKRARPVADPGPLQAGLAGEWELRVPGGVWYSADGRSVYRHYTPGAAMNRLTIQADGRYRWGKRQGRLEEVRPWHAQAERRYYRLAHEGGAEYELYLHPQGELVLLFGGVGGHAASGTRKDAPAAASAGASYMAGARVEILWKGRWYPGVVRTAEKGRYFVHYDGWDASWDEWVAPQRLRPVSNKP